MILLSLVLVRLRIVWIGSGSRELVVVIREGSAIRNIVDIEKNIVKRNYVVIYRDGI